MKIIFFGTPDYVIPVLNSLHGKLKVKGKSPIVAVVTQPPKPAGRKRKLQFSAVDTWGHKKGVPIFYDANDLLENKISADLGILASYGTIIPKKIIDLFPHGILNIHPSMLPLWRGASPVQATIISADQAGASIIKLDKELDHGPIISQFKDEVLHEDTAETLRERLFERSAEVLVTLIPAYLAGKITLRKQDDSKVTYTRQIKKADAFIPPKYINAALQGRTLKGKWKIDFMNYSLVPNASCLDSFIHAMQPWPQAWTLVRIKNQELRFKILKTHLELNTPRAGNSSTRKVAELKVNHKSQITNHHLVLDEIQLEGKNPVSWKQFREGYPEIKFS